MTIVVAEGQPPYTDSQKAILANIAKVHDEKLFGDDSISSEIRQAAQKELTGIKALEFVEDAIRSRSE